MPNRYILKAVKGWLPLVLTVAIAACYADTNNRNKLISTYYLTSFEDLLNKQAKADSITPRKIPDPYKPQTVKVITGYYLNELLSRLEQLPQASEKDFKEWLKGKTPTLPSLLLMELGRLEFPENHLEGLKWFAAGQLRMAYDAKRCADEKASETPIRMLMGRYNKLARYSTINQQEFIIAQEEALKWDKRNSYPAEPIWMCAFSDNAIQYNHEILQPVKVQLLLKPPETWPALRQEVQNKMTNYIFKNKLPQTNRFYL